MSSKAEQVLELVKVLLLGATGAGQSVWRGRVDPFAQEDLPALNVRRGPTDETAWAQGQDHIALTFDIDVEVRGADWETQADTLHEQVYDLLKGSAPLQALVSGLRRVSTDPTAEAGDDVAGRITARFQCQFLQRRG